MLWYRNHLTLADRYAGGAVNVNVGGAFVDKVSVTPLLFSDVSVKHAYRIVVCGG